MTIDTNTVIVWTNMGYVSAHAIIGEQRWMFHCDPDGSRVRGLRQKRIDAAGGYRTVAANAHQIERLVPIIEPLIRAHLQRRST